MQPEFEPVVKKESRWDRYTTRGKILVALGWTALAILVMWLATEMANDHKAETEAYTTQYSAERACERSVKAKLKSPSTAEFEITSARESGRDWTIMGYVDAENSFGAKIRNTWVCEATRSGDSFRATSDVF